jgi:60 kDa SS-A/Ro ribonucleoprotein
MRFTRIFSRRETSQREPIPGEDQVLNSAGGYVYPVDDWTRLERFLVLGTEGGTYYSSEQKLSRENAEAVVRCVQADGVRVVGTIVEISREGRAPKNSPAIFALALAASLGDATTRSTALKAMPLVCRTGAHLFEFCEYAQGLRGWGRGMRRGIAIWYAAREPRDLAYQLVKYQQREGWSHRDLLRLTHPKAEGVRNDLFYWAVKGWPGVGEEPHPDETLRFIWAVERAKGVTDEAEMAALIRDYRLPREAVPTQLLTSPKVWEALLHDTPMTALIRNLGNLSKVGLLVPGSDAEARVVELLGDVERLRRARVHPIALLSALRVYGQGHGVRGQGEWEASRKVVDALDAAFYTAFKAVDPTGKRFLLALDVSGSMGSGEIAGVPGLTPREASAALALVTMAVEPNCQVVGFQTSLTPLTVSPRQRLDDVVRTVSNLRFGGTDCALPMLWALEKRREFDAFVVLTDNETWAGDIHPSQALVRYRKEMGIAARLVVVGMTATSFSIADPKDAGMMDVVGFDTATPQVISNYVR